MGVWYRPNMLLDDVKYLISKENYLEHQTFYDYYTASQLYLVRRVDQGYSCN